MEEFSFLVSMSCRQKVVTMYVYYININNLFSCNSCCKCLCYFHWVYFLNMFMDYARLRDNNLYTFYMLVCLGC